jgi:phage terminase large subunit GpA-like protein
MLYTVGTEIAKETLHGRLRLETPGPRYQHFPRRDAMYGQAYFEQLTAEVVRTRYLHGYPIKVWEKIRDRNEALDIRVYATAAYDILNPNIPRIKAMLDAQAKERTPISPPKDYQLKPAEDGKPTEVQTSAPKPPDQKPQPSKLKSAVKPPRTGFIGRWKKW